MTALSPKRSNDLDVAQIEIAESRFMLRGRKLAARFPIPVIHMRLIGSIPLRPFAAPVFQVSDADLSTFELWPGYLTNDNGPSAE